MIIVGAQGFAKELLVLLEDNRVAEFAFFDDVSIDSTGCIFEHYQVLRSTELCCEYFRGDNRFMLGIGDPQVRFQLYKQFKDFGGSLIGISSIHATIGAYNAIDSTCTIMPGVLIENDNRIGKAVLLHVGTFVSHDVVVGEFSEISPYAKLLGRCEIGSFCSIGTGAIILPKVKVGSHAVVGAGAVVTKDVENGTTVVGIPAKRK